MYNDYRDQIVPGTLVTHSAAPEYGAGRVMDVTELIPGSRYGNTQIPIKNDPWYKKHPEHVWVKFPHDMGSMWDLDQLIPIVSTPLLCQCAWNKHPLFCKCK